MKKLEKLKLHDFKKISADDQKTIKGGDGYWITAEDGNQYYYVGDINILSYQEPESGWGSICPACQTWHELNEQKDGGLWTPFGEFITNTLAHIIGSGSHINGSETYYTITMADGTIISGMAGSY